MQRVYPSYGRSGGGSDSARASAVRASHERKTAMLVVYPARSLAICAAQSEGRKKGVFRGRLQARIMMGSESHEEEK